MYTVSGNNRVDFTAYAPMHTFRGWAEQGFSGTIDADFEKGTLRTMEAAVNTLDFTTGDDERTRAMSDYFDFPAHPRSSFVMTQCRSLAKAGSGYKAEITGILDFAGIRRQLPLTCMLIMQKEHIDLALTFKWSFKAYGLKAPRLLFLKVKDIVDIRVHLEFYAKEGE
ncbi:MAG: hypothetical protein CSA20_02150 [Deltaproteobacteria bacterium]|nr:MAG: hypothetical protein CSA20_02150 [Deltaproteobacteria bacterium]